MTQVITRYPTLEAAQKTLLSRGFVFVRHSIFIERQYWARSDGQPEIFLDHSATITGGGGAYVISDFLTKEG